MPIYRRSITVITAHPSFGRERYTAAAAARVSLPLSDLLRHRRARAFLCAVRAGAAWKMEKGPLPASCASPVAGPVSRSNASTPLSLPVSVPGSHLSRGTRPAPFGREREPLPAAGGRFCSPPVRHPPCRVGSRSRPVAPYRWRVMAATSFCAAAAARRFSAPAPAGTRSAGVGLLPVSVFPAAWKRKGPLPAGFPAPLYPGAVSPRTPARRTVRVLVFCVYRKAGTPRRFPRRVPHLPLWLGACRGRAPFAVSRCERWPVRGKAPCPLPAAPLRVSACRTVGRKHAAGRTGDGGGFLFEKVQLHKIGGFRANILCKRCCVCAIV